MLQLKQLNAGSRAEWLVEKRYTFGTGTENQYKVEGQGVAEIHAGLEVNGDDIKLFNLVGGDSITVNGKVLEKNIALKPGDEFSIGDASFKLADPKTSRKPRQKLAPELRTWTLKAKNTALANKSFPLEGSQTIGRSNECDICLNVVHLSRRHAQITVKEDYIQLDDLNSSNGTFLNGKKITATQVRAGDEIGFDTLKFEVFGPRSALDKTQVRAGEMDSDSTTMRPMITEADLANAVKKEKAKPRKPREANVAKAAEAIKKTQTTTQQSDDATNKTGLIAIGFIILLIAGAAAYVMLG